MAWFLNKKTGLKWEVYGEHAERLTKDPDYEEIQPEVESNVSQDLSKLSKAELVKLAEEKGIGLHSDVTKAQIIDALTKEPEKA